MNTNTAIHPLCAVYGRLNNTPLNNDLTNISTFHCSAEIMNIDVNISATKIDLDKWRIIFTIKSPHNNKNMCQPNSKKLYRKDILRSATNFKELAPILLDRSKEMISDMLEHIVSSWHSMPLLPQMPFSLLVEAGVYCFVLEHKKIIGIETQESTINNLLKLSTHFKNNPVSDITDRSIDAAIPNKLTPTIWKTLKKASEFMCWVHQNFPTCRNIANPFKDYLDSHRPPETPPELLAKQLSITHMLSTAQNAQLNNIMLQWNFEKIGYLPLFALMLRDTVLSTEELFLLKWESIKFTETNLGTMATIHIKKDFRTSSTISYAAPASPFASAILKKLYDHELTKTTNRAKKSKPNDILSKKTIFPAGSNDNFSTFERMKDKLRHYIRNTFEDITLTLNCLKNTRKVLLQSAFSPVDNPAHISFMLGQSLSANTTVDHYASMSKAPDHLIEFTAMRRVSCWSNMFGKPVLFNPISSKKVNDDGTVTYTQTASPGKMLHCVCDFAKHEVGTVDISSTYGVKLLVEVEDS